MPQQQTDPYADIATPTQAADPYASIAVATKKAAPAEEKNFNNTSLDETIPLDSYGNATMSGLQSVGRGLRDAGKGALQFLDPRTDSHNSGFATEGAGYLPARMVDSAIDLGKMAKQVPGAVKDIYHSSDPLGTTAGVLQETAGQGAGQALVAAGTEGVLNEAKMVPKALESSPEGLPRMTPKIVQGATDIAKNPTVQRVAGAPVRVAGKVLSNPVVAHAAAPVITGIAGSTLGAAPDLALATAGGLSGEALKVPQMIQRAGQRMAEVGLPEKEVLTNRTSRIVSGLLDDSDKLANRMDKIKESGGQVPDSMSSQLKNLHAKILDESKSFPISPETRARIIKSKLGDAAPVEPKTVANPSLDPKNEISNAPLDHIIPKNEIKVPGEIPAKPNGSTAPKDIPSRSYQTSPNLSATDASTKVDSMVPGKKPMTSAEAPAPAAMTDAHPVKITYDEYGQPTADGTDGRHRVIQAIQNGEKRIQVVVDRGHGPVTTTVDPRILARQMGVTKDSLAATDAQQAYRKGNLQPREAKMVPEQKPMLKDAEPVAPQKPQAAPTSADWQSKGFTDPKQISQVSNQLGHPVTLEDFVNKPQGREAATALGNLTNAEKAEYAQYAHGTKGKSFSSSGGWGKGATKEFAEKLMATKKPADVLKDIKDRVWEKKP